MRVLTLVIAMGLLVASCDDGPKPAGPRESLESDRLHQYPSPRLNSHPRSHSHTEGGTDAVGACRTRTSQGSDVSNRR